MAALISVFIAITLSLLITLILYGRKVALMELDVRREGMAGEKAHQQAIATQQQIEQEQKEEYWKSRRQVTVLINRLIAWREK